MPRNSVSPALIVCFAHGHRDRISPKTRGPILRSLLFVSCAHSGVARSAIALFPPFVARLLLVSFELLGVFMNDESIHKAHGNSWQGFVGQIKLTFRKRTKSESVDLCYQ